MYSAAVSPNGADQCRQGKCEHEVEAWKHRCSGYSGQLRDGAQHSYERRPKNWPRAGEMALRLRMATTLERGGGGARL